MACRQIIQVCTLLRNTCGMMGSPWDVFFEFVLSHRRVIRRDAIHLITAAFHETNVVRLWAWRNSNNIYVCTAGRIRR